MASNSKVANQDSLQAFANAAAAYIELLRDPSHHDVTIVCGDRTWRCQRAILCQRCSFFRAALTNTFKEADERVIDLSDDHADAVDVLLLFLYTLELPDPSNIGLSAARRNDVAFSIADKYGVPELKSKAQSELIKRYRTKRSVLLDSEGRCRRVKEHWRMDVEGSDQIRSAMVNGFVKYAADVMDNDNFLGFCAEEPTFLKEFMIGLKAVMRR